MMHDYHDALPGFDDRQILHDGCAECERRGEDIARAISYLDPLNFERAWNRAFAFERGFHETTGRISRAEAPLLSALWAVQIQLERRGVILGSIPGFGDAFTSLGGAS